jgi:type I restriction enzyme, S subunit
MALGITPIDIVNKGTHPLLVKDNDWERVELNNIAEVQNGYAFSSNLFNHKDGLPLIRIRDIFSEKTENYYSGDYNEDFIINHKDILIGMDGDFKISRWPGQKGLLNQRVCRIKFFSSYYLESFLFLCVQPYLDAIHSETSAVTVKHLSSRTINEIPLPLPPLPIQRAIVSKIEALFSDLDNGIANFKKAQEQLKIYRQAVLKKAFEGELTKEWRAKQTHLPTASALLKQIKEERQNHYNQQMEDWKKAVKDWEKGGSIGKKPSKPTQQKELPPLKKEELEELPNLPVGWAWCRIADIGSVETGATPKRGNSKYWENGSIPWITSGALNDDFVRECKEYVTEQALKETNIKVFPKHSLVMAMYGEGKTRGKSSELLIDTSTNQAIACIIQKNTESEIRKYLKSFLVKIYQDIRRKSSGGVQPNINLDIVKNLNLPLCSIQEQTQIVQEIESRLSVCDKMEQSINESIEKAEALRQSILKKAFEGKLLSQAEIELCKQAADYEPASELLKKIQAEKLAKEQEKKKKPTVKKKSKK